jgi:RNA recognition motif-containing protein
MTLYLGNFDYNTTPEEIRTLLEPFGEVDDVRLVEHRPGTAFAEMPRDVDALRAVAKLDGAQIQGRRWAVRVAKDQTKCRTSPAGVK